ncbi:MAG: aldehyde ferredoxin oxidoreductase, partial [Bacteroidales bacterium]|nr:aldehyde ferredoxin oxidoreductase [Bacteroidales bacterium]
MYNGFNGKVLHVNLTRMLLEVEQPSEAFYRKYMGGSAFGAYYLLKHTPPETEPLAAENTLTLAAGVVTGAPIS